jgi:gliding motility-associated-like protein
MHVAKPPVIFIKKYYGFFLLWAFVLISYSSTKANHLMGSDITYRCIDKWKYIVTLTVYRDCNGVTLGMQQQLRVSCNVSTWTKIVQLSFVGKRDITGLNPECNVPSRCLGWGYPYGVEEHTYTGELDLSAVVCDEFTLSWSLSARNAAITTGAASKNFYTSATLYTNLSACNSSPIFSTPAAALVCLGSDFTFNNGAIDTFDTNDSLSYKFTDPLSSANQPIPYFSSWSATKPLTFLGFPDETLPIPQGFHLDSITGNLSFRPIAVNQASVIVLEVTEWRKESGVMRIVGITRRDMQIIVIDCGTNSPPVIIGQSLSACPNQQVCIKINTTDANPRDSVKISWNRGIAGASYISSEGTVQRDTAIICWTPTESDVRTTPYVFTITARDNGCPLGGQAVKAFTIFVDSKPQPSYTVNDSEQCLKNHQFDFTNTSTTSTGIFNSFWSFSDGKKIDSVNAKNIQFDDTGIYGVNLKLKSFYGCEDSIYGTVRVLPHPNPNFTTLKKYYCIGSPSILLSPVTQGGVFSGKNIVGGEYLPTVYGLDTVWYTVTEDGCKSDTVKFTIVYPYPELNLGPDTIICKTEAIVLDATFPLSAYLWQDGNTQPMYTVTNAGLYKVTLFNICDTLTDSVNVSVCRYSFFPNAFTPNGDGFNDVFIPFFEGVGSMNMKIYDRWGGLVFESTEPNKGWDGNFATGETAPIGVYTWLIELKFNSFGTIRSQIENGTLTLLR